MTEPLRGVRKHIGTGNKGESDMELPRLHHLPGQQEKARLAQRRSQLLILSLMFRHVGCVPSPGLPDSKTPSPTFCEPRLPQPIGRVPWKAVEYSSLEGPLWR